MNPNYQEREFSELIETTGVKVIFCLTEIAASLKRKFRKAKRITFITSSTNDVSSLLLPKIDHKLKALQKTKSLYSMSGIINFDNVNSMLPNPTADNPAILQFTGGTTGKPKAAVGLHRNLVANTIQFAKWCDLRKGQETILSVIPLYHVYGMVLSMCLGVYLGAKIILMNDPRRTDLILQNVKIYHPTFFPCVPSIFYNIAYHKDVTFFKSDLGSIKACISGSAPLNSEVKKKFESLTGGKILEGYGLSEAPTATHCNPLHGENKINSIGMPLPDVEACIVSIENKKIDLQTGDIGELKLKGPQVMKGYFNDSKETKHVLQDGWLTTGDIARMDDDGYFFIIDRKKSLIKVGGFQVWPSEIEKIINSHPAVKESCVGGIPDFDQDEKVIAWIVSKSNMSLTNTEIMEWCKRYLVFYKIPKEVYFVHDLPKTPTGKILRRELIAKYLKKKPE